MYGRMMVNLDLFFIVIRGCAMLKTKICSKMLKPHPGVFQEGYQTYELVGVGCERYARPLIWKNYRMTMSGDESFLLFEERMEVYDVSELVLICRGRCVGVMSDIPLKDEDEIRHILSVCKAYRVDMVDPTQEVGEEVKLIITWK